MTFGPGLGIGAGSRGRGAAIIRLEGWDSESGSPDLWGLPGRPEAERWPMANDVISRAFVIKPPQIPKTRGLERFGTGSTGPGESGDSKDRATPSRGFCSCDGRDHLLKHLFKTTHDFR